MWTASAPGIEVPWCGCQKSHEGEPSIEEIATIGLDIAKQVFQVHGIDAAGAVVVRRKLRRDEVVRFFEALPPCLIGIEACATAHHWARLLAGLRHEVRLTVASYALGEAIRRLILIVALYSPSCSAKGSSANDENRPRARNSGQSPAGAADAAGTSDPASPPILLGDIGRPTSEPSAGRHLRRRRRPAASARLSTCLTIRSRPRGASRAFLWTFIRSSENH